MKIVAYILSIVYYLLFGLSLLIFHVLQWIGYNLWKYRGHKKVVDIMNGTLTYLLYVLGTNVKFISKHPIPKEVPLIIVSNHQGMNDISPISFFLRKYHPKFVSKIELGKGIPSVSYNLTHGGSVLIDRKDPRQALTALRDFGKYIEKNKYSAVIFPEGTRGKDGRPKRFSDNGLKMLTKFAPSAHIIPMTINNCWKLNKNGKLPLELGLNISFELHEAIAPESMPFEDLFQKVEMTVKNSVIL